MKYKNGNQCEEKYGRVRGQNVIVKDSLKW